MDKRKEWNDQVCSTKGKRLREGTQGKTVNLRSIGGVVWDPNTGEAS